MHQEPRSAFEASESSPPTWTESQLYYEELAREVCPYCRLTTKEGWFWEFASWVLLVASLGRFSRKRFLEDYASTLGPIQAYPRHWPRISEFLIVHEARHTAQFARAGWLVPGLGWLGAPWRVWVGILPMAIAYGVLPLPIGLAWGRLWLELDADSYAWETALARGWLSAEQVRARSSTFARTLSSWDYLLAWPTAWALRIFEQRAEAVIARFEKGVGSLDHEAGE